MADKWGFYQVVLGAIALMFTLIGAGWAYYERQKNKKNISYSKSDSVPLIANNTGIENIRILHGDKQVVDPHVTTLEIRNKGRIPIIPADFIEPLKIKAKSDANFVGVTISAVDPENLSVSMEHTDIQVLIKPLLLNGGDGFKINILTEKAFDDPIIDGRVAGVRVIREIKPERVKKITAIIIGVASGIIANVMIKYIVDFVMNR